MLVNRYRRELNITAFLLFAVANSAYAGAENGLSIMAQLSPKQQSVLASEMPGRLDFLAVKEGDSFKQGDVLASFNCAVEDGKFEKANAHLALAVKKRDMAQQLRQFNSTSDFEVEMAEIEIAKAKADVNSAKAVTSKCLVEAPFAGKVAELNAFTYEFLGLGKPIMKVIDDSVLEVEFLAPSMWLSWLEPRMAFTVQVSETSTEHTAQVERISAHIDPVSHTIKVVGKINNPDNALLAGMTGQIQFKQPLNPQ